MTKTSSPKGNLYVVSAPSGAGKTSLLKRLIEDLPGVVTSVSHTTRIKREAEVDGVDYHFVDMTTFEAMVQQGDFLENAQVFGNFYGTSLSQLEKQLAEGNDVILEIDWQGARQVSQKLQETRSIFILPPSKEALLQRLQARGQDDESTIQSRMNEAQNEMSHYAEYDYLVINDDFEIAMADLKSILLAERQKTETQKQKNAHLLSNLFD
ncbi:MAG: guanylate kinase [Gammaproteobacteria bacterium]|nr:guanylate kinase [Gammaproteobacteria bacterium]